MIQVKDCSRCNRQLPIANFYRIERPPRYGRRARVEYSSRCKTCARREEGARYVPRPRPERSPAERREIASARQKRYRERHPERVRRNSAVQNARRRSHRNVPPETAEYMEVLRGDPCAYCGDPMEHFDHISPVALDGDNAADNFTAACAACNFSKNRTPLLQFLLRAGR